MKRLLVLFALLVGAVALATPASAHGHHGRHYSGHGHYYSYSPRLSLGFGYYGYYGWPYYGGYGYYRPYYAVEPVRVVRASRRTAAVETDTRPKKALVTLDGKPIGQARDFNGPWDLLVLSPGSHTLEFSAPGHMTLRVALEAERGAYYRFTDTLLEGEGLDPRSSEVAPAPPGEPAGVSGRTDPAPEGRLTSGRLHLQAGPPDAAVYLDGEFLARADELARLHGAVPVAVGEHTLEVIRPGYEGVTRVIVVERDEPARVRIELEPAN